MFTNASTFCYIIATSAESNFVKGRYGIVCQSNVRLIANYDITREYTATVLHITLKCFTTALWIFRAVAVMISDIGICFGGQWIRKSV